MTCRTSVNITKVVTIQTVVYFSPTVSSNWHRVCFIFCVILCRKKVRQWIYSLNLLEETMKKMFITVALLAVIIAPVSAFACACGGNQYRTGTGPVSMEEAKQISSNYLSTIDTRLTADEIRLEGQAYLVNIKDENDNPVATLSIDTTTGAIKPVF